MSKGFLAGKDTEDAIRINPEDFYREHGIETEARCEVSALDPKRKRLVLKSGGDFGFNKLIVATGAHPRTLTSPGQTLATCTTCDPWLIPSPFGARRSM